MCKAHHIMAQIWLTLILASFAQMILLICEFSIFAGFFVAYSILNLLFLAPFLIYYNLSQTNQLTKVYYRLFNLCASIFLLAL